MSKKSLIINIICLLAIIPFSVIIQDLNIFKTILTLSITIIFISSFHHLNISQNINIQNNYNDSNLLSIFLQIIKIILILSGIYIILLYPLSLITSKILDIQSLSIIFILSGLIIPFYPIIKVTNEYLEIKKVNKINVLQLYYIINTTILIITSIFISLVFKLNTDTNNIILISSFILSGILTLTIIYLYLKKYKYLTIKNLLSQNKNHNKPKLTKIIMSESYISIITIIKNSYIYISIVYVYYILKNIYNYTSITITQIITNTYCYGLLVIITIALIIIYIIEKKYQLSNKQPKDINISAIYYRLAVILLPIIIIMIILSPALWTLLFNTNNYSYILVGLSVFLFFLIFYHITLKTLTTMKNKKISLIITSIGLIFKLIFTPPIIASFYRMGYPLVMGDVTSTIISYIIVIIIGNYFIQKTYKVPIFSNLEKILNIIYNNIILMVELILLQLIITINPTTRSKALLLIIIYSIIAIIFYAVRLYIAKRNKNRKKE